MAVLHNLGLFLGKTAGCAILVCGWNHTIADVKGSEGEVVLRLRILRIPSHLRPSHPASTGRE